MREKGYLRQVYAAILSSTGIILVLSSVVMLLPLVVLLAYPQEAPDTWAFLIPAICLGLLGLALLRIFRPSTAVTLSIQEGGVIVLLSWVVVILFSAWPLAWAANLDFSRAVFESVSGWTTTGLSVVDVTRVSHMTLLWRSIMQFAGGAGLAIIMMSAIIGPSGVGISSAEGRGDQLVPHVRQSARLVMIIYICYAAGGTIAYWLAGMDIFDAVNHSFAAVSTGGFSTRPESIGYWNSVYIEAVTLALMLLGNMSFVTAWLLWRGRLRFFARNGEIRLMSVVIPAAIAVTFLATCRTLYPHIGKVLRVSIFEIVSALTTTGFSTVSYNNWNPFGILVLIGLMLIGGGTCSTAGGIKQFRIYTLWKVLMEEFRRPFLPRTATVEQAVWEGARRAFINDSRVRQIAVFVFLYLAAFAAGTLTLCAYGYTLPDSLFEFASSLGTVGLSVGVTSAGMPDGALWVETIAMFLGRLEFFVIIVSALKVGRDAYRMT